MKNEASFWSCCLGQIKEQFPVLELLGPKYLAATSQITTQKLNTPYKCLTKLGIGGTDL